MLVLKVPEERQLLILVKVTFNCVLAAFPPVQLSLSSSAFMIHTIASSFEWGKKRLREASPPQRGKWQKQAFWYEVACVCLRVYVYT